MDWNKPPFNLVAAAIVLWNTVYLERAIQGATENAGGTGQEY
jgi:TnpA family transposase